MKNDQAARPIGLVSEMVKSAGETGIDVMGDLVNQIIVERVIPEEWELSTTVNYC